MQRGIVVVLALAAGLAAGELDSRISGGKAKRLVDRAQPMIEEADAIYKAWVLDLLVPETEKERLEHAIDLYDTATALLQEALDEQFDSGVNYQCKVAARRLQKLRFHVHFRLSPPARDAEDGDASGTDAAPAEPDAPVAPDDADEPATAPPELAEDERPSARVTFEANRPPASPTDVALPRMAAAVDERRVRRDVEAIEALLRDYYGSFKPNRLLYRHRLCRGTGDLGGTPCEECGGTGVGIDLHHFRKAFWGAYTPLLRDADGALEALEAFLAHSRAHPDALGPVVRSFRIEDVEHEGLWARAKVTLKTKEEEMERTVTLVGIGSSWFFYHPATDRELLPEEAAVTR